MVRISHMKFILAASIAISTLLSACSTTTPSVVRVAVNFPTGISVGQDMLNAVQLALKEADGKAGNIPVELTSLDSSDPNGNPVSVDLAVSTTKAAIADPSVVAYIGPATSDQTRATAPLLNAASITQLTPSASWPGLTKPGFSPGEPGIYYPTGQRHFFRLVPSDDVQALTATHWVKQMGFNNVYVIADKSASSGVLAGIFEANAGDQSLTIIGKAQLDIASASPDDLKELADRVAATNPDVVFFPSGDNHGDRMLEALRTSDPKMTIICTDGVTTEDLSSQAALLEGIYTTDISIQADQLASAADFLKNYQAAYHKVPPPFALTSYVAMQIVLQAIKQSDTPTRAGVLASMGNLGSITDSLGTWHFDTNGDTSLTRISGMQLKNGQWTAVSVVS